ncbi:2836_t:CDS:1, partial [Dentiscutata erythropus]
PPSTKEEDPGIVHLNRKEKVQQREKKILILRIEIAKSKQPTN